MKNDLKDKIAGALYGVAVGDALGAPLEFMSAEQIEQQYGTVTEMIGGGWLDVQPGETTDDTAMTLAVAEGIMENPDAPIPAIGERFIQWVGSGPKDIGGTCNQSIRFAEQLGRKRPSEEVWYRSAKTTAQYNHGRSGGNGALMRTIYPALFYLDRQQAIAIACSQRRMTHWDQESDEACRLYSGMVHFLISAAQFGLNENENISAYITGILEQSRYNLEEIEKKGHLNEENGLKPTGYVVDSLECVLFAFWHASNSFEGAVAYAANLGGDADTIAAICGGLAGAFYGFDAIPKRWVNALSKEDRERLDQAVEAAVENREAYQKRTKKV